MDRFKSAKRASTLGILGNIFLLIIKGIIGLATKSQAMIADTLNSAGDIFSSVMTYVGNKIASKPKDEDHNLGHGKAEYIYSMLISIIMMFMAVIIIKDGTEALVTNKTYTFSKWLIIVCTITIIIKFLLYLYTYSIGKKYKNLLVKANAKDHINDCLLTSCNLISCIFAQYNIYLLDGIVGMIIGLWILVTGMKIFKESYDVLMDKAISIIEYKAKNIKKDLHLENTADKIKFLNEISKETKKKVYEIIKTHKEIKKTQNFNSTPIGYMYQISLTIFVDGNLTTFESHKIADNLEKEITKSIDEIYLTVIHVNPIKINESSNRE